MSTDPDTYHSTTDPDFGASPEPPDPPEDDPADQLRRAAAKAREAAEGATHEGRTRWGHGRTRGSRAPVVIDDAQEPSVLIEAYAAVYEDVLTHAAPWDPHVAELVAAWLDDDADQADRNLDRPPRRRVDVSRASAVARALLGEGS